MVELPCGCAVGGGGGKAATSAGGVGEGTAVLLFCACCASILALAAASLAFAAAICAARLIGGVAVLPVGAEAAGGNAEDGCCGMEAEGLCECVWFAMPLRRRRWM